MAAKFFPRDPEGGDNIRRAEWAEEALSAFQSVTGADDCDALGDLLCNLMHLAARKPELFGDFESMLGRARDHYAAETDGRGPLGNAQYATEGR